MAIKAQSQLVYQNSAPFPAGRVTLAGAIRNGTLVNFTRMRVLGSFAAVYLHGGSGVYRDGMGREREVSAGDLILVYPDSPHRYGPVADAGVAGGRSRWDEFYVVFEGQIFDAWRKAGLLREEVTIRRLMPIGYWHKRLREVVEPPDGGAAEPLQLVVRLQQFLADALLHRGSGDEAAENGDFLRRAKAELEAVGEEPAPLPEVAWRIGVGYETFRKRFAELSGMAPNQYRLSRRIERACQMMSRGEKGIAEIARATGFCDEFHFSRRFKAMTGMSPTAFRRQLGR